MRPILKRNAYGIKALYSSKLELDKEINYLLNSNTDGGPDIFQWYDSDTNMVYSGYKDSENNVVYEKAIYKKFDTSYLNVSLSNAYKIPGCFTDKSQIYSYGPILPDSDYEIGKVFAFFLKDSEGFSVWRKRKGTDGTSRNDYVVANYSFKPPRIKSVSSLFSLDNAIDSDLFLGGSIYTSRNPKLKIEFTGDLTRTGGSGTSVDIARRIMTRDSEPFSSIVMFKTSSSNQILSVDLPYWQAQEMTFRNTRVLNDDPNWSGTIYEGLSGSSADSDAMYFKINDTIDFYKEDLIFRHISEYGDSEIVIEKPFVIYDDDSEFTDVITDSDFRVMSSFSTDEYQNEDKVWKVFDDSDNTGFKAPLGVQSGWIGWKHGYAIGDTYHLKRAIIENNESTPYSSIPYNFEIEGKPFDSDGWVTLATVTNSKEITKNILISEENQLIPCHAFRVKIKDCQPTFDSDIDSLEIKNIRFVVKSYKYTNQQPQLAAFYTDDTKEYTINVGNTDVKASGLMIGGGGAGGAGDVNGWIFGGMGRIGGGGAGGGYIRIDDITLKNNHTYKLKIGKGGVSSGEDGGTTYLYDATNGKYIIKAGGGKGGDETSVFTGGTAEGGRGGVVDVFDSDGIHNITYFDSDGGRGGSYRSRSEFPGQPGIVGTVLFFNDRLNYTPQTDYDLCSGGGGGTWHSNQNGLNYVNDGRPPGGPSGGRGASGDFGSNGLFQFTNADHAPANRGGGGGGGSKVIVNDDSFDIHYGRGGSGYAYLIFK